MQIKRSITTFKNDIPAKLVAALCAALFCVLLTLFSLAIVQSDDYYYKTFLNGSLLNFLNLTKNHFLTFNGRALVHFTAHIVLHFSPCVYSLFLSLILLFIPLFSLRFYGIEKLGIRDSLLFTASFYILILLSGRDSVKEALMWMTSSFNYVLPCLFAVLTLYFHEKRSRLVYLSALFAGASTEQWGAAAGAMLLCAILIKIRKYICSLPRTKKGALKKNALNMRFFFLEFSPLLPLAIGYATIFLSPATQNRLVTRFSFNVVRDFTHLSEIFLSKNCAVAVLLISCATLALLPLSKKKAYFPLIFAVVPFVLIVLSLVSPRISPIAFLSFLALLLCAGIILQFTFFKKTGIFLIGAFVSAIIMLPADTFEPRVTFPMTLLLIIAVLPIFVVFFNEIPIVRAKKGVFYPFTAALATVLALCAFFPTFTGFYRNYLIERENLENIREARETGVLHYNMDYDKRFAMRQMFNDSYFYSTFTALYGLENSDIIFESKIYPRVYHNGSPTGLVAPTEYGETFVPIAALLRSFSGSVEVDANATLLSLGDKKLILKDEIFEYGSTRLDSTNLNTKRDFYTLSIVPEILENALGIEITVGEARVDVNF